MAHWRSCAGISADFVLLTDTRCTGAEQGIISNRPSPTPFRSLSRTLIGDLMSLSGLQAEWQGDQEERPILPVLTGPRSIIWKSYVKLRNIMSRAMFENQCNKALCAVIVYYGHPEMKEATVRDLTRLNIAVEETEMDMVIGGDINISDQDDFAIPVDSAWLEAHYWWAQQHQQPLQDTYHAGRAAR